MWNYSIRWYNIEGILYMEPTSTVRFYLVLKHLGDKRSRSGSLIVNSDAPSWRNYLGFLQPAPVDFSLIYICLQAFSTEKQVSPRKNLTLWTCSYLLQMFKCFPSFFPPAEDFLLALSQYYAILHNKYSSHFHNGNLAPQNQGSSNQSFDKDSSTPIVQKTTDFLDSRLLKPGSKGFYYHVFTVMFCCYLALTQT